MRTSRRQSIEVFLQGDQRWPPPRPKPTFGECDVDGCDRLASTGRMLCRRHDPAWRAAGRPEGEERARFLATEAVRMVTPGRMKAQHLRVVSATAVDLSPLTPQLRAEVLCGLQASARLRRQVPPHVVVSVIRLVARMRVDSIATIKLDNVKTPPVRDFLRHARDEARLVTADPEAEMRKDIWAMDVLGKAGRVDFTDLSPIWLREAAKAWAREKVSSVHERSLSRVIESLEHFATYLKRRDDRGADVAALDRAAMAAYLSRLRVMEQRGQLSLWLHARTVKDMRQFLRECRQFGVMEAGAPLHGLPGTFAVHDGDLHAFRGIKRQGRRDLPQVVMDQLLDDAALVRLEEMHGADGRALVEIHAEIGRRPSETCSLRWACLEWDGPTEPVLVHDMPKVKKIDYRLPITMVTANAIKAQQARVRQRFPGANVKDLFLFPRADRNPHGDQHISALQFNNRVLRPWVEALDALLGPDGEPFDRARVIAYAFRHTFAQRHADAGTPVEVLADLMGHEDLKTTQGYYDVGDQRKRLAIDQLRPLQLDRRGDDTPFVERLVESQRQRERVGQVAVTFGVCVEPSNVRASGHACQFRHRCFGCEHFRTDPSYLPELKAHLTQLLADRERLATQAPELAEWARHDARPPEEEIAAVRRLIRRCEERLDDLPGTEREAVQEAITILRRTRAQLAGRVAPGTGQLLTIRQLKPTLNPRVADSHGR